MKKARTADVVFNSLREWESKYIPSSQLQSLKEKLESDPAALGIALAKKSIKESCHVNIKDSTKN